MLYLKHELKLEIFILSKSRFFFICSTILTVYLFQNVKDENSAV